MALSHADVQRIAHLARLHLSPDEADRSLAQLNDILAMIETMQAIDTAGVQPMAHPLGGVQRLREDAVVEVIDRAANMRNAPLAHDGLFLVPKVIE